MAMRDRASSSTTTTTDPASTRSPPTPRPHRPTLPQFHPTPLPKSFTRNLGFFNYSILGLFSIFKIRIKGFIYQLVSTFPCHCISIFLVCSLGATTFCQMTLRRATNSIITLNRMAVRKMTTYRKAVSRMTCRIKTLIKRY